jgi:hypothetical protein
MTTGVNLVTIPALAKPWTPTWNIFGSNSDDIPPIPMAGIMRNNPSTSAGVVPNVIVSTPAIIIIAIALIALIIRPPCLVVT